MNIRNNNILKSFAALLLCVFVGSCSQEEIDIDSVRTLPPGKYPLMFTATVDGMISRADGDSEPWGDGDMIATQIKGNSLIGYYVLNTDGSVKESDNPLAWPVDRGIVKAWYPGEKFPITKDITDQSKGYHVIDFLYAESVESKYNETVALCFKHQMAKVSCKLIKGDGVTEDDLKTATVQYYGFTEATFSEGAVTGDKNGWIKSTSDLTALLVPQVMSGKEFIKVDLTLTINGAKIPKTLVYTPQETVNLEAGKAYTFNIKVQKDRLEVQTISGSWAESLENTVPTSDKYRIFLPEDTEELGELEFSKNVITNGTANTRAGSGRLVEVIGNSFTISYKPTTDNCDLGLVFVNKNTKNQVKRIYFEKESDGYYEFTYTIASPIEDPVYLEIGEHIEIGDILFQDGKWSCAVLANKTPVGMVFRIGPGRSGNDKPLDIPANYGWNREIRGYAVALKDASNSKERWSSSGKQIFLNGDNTLNYYSGLYITDSLKKVIPKKKLDISNFPAFQKAEEYKPVAPEETSGWYLPSEQQLSDIHQLFVHPIRREWITNAGGEFFQAGGYWSATEAAPTTARAVSFNYNNSSGLGSVKKTTTYYVRAVLTF